MFSRLNTGTFHSIPPDEDDSISNKAFSFSIVRPISFSHTENGKWKVNIVFFFKYVNWIVKELQFYEINKNTHSNQSKNKSL